MRKCNQFNCDGIMRPTRTMYDAGGKIEKPDHRIFRCPICGKENPWLDKPKMDGSISQLHKNMNNEMSLLSLMSDPKFYGYKRPKRRIR